MHARSVYMQILQRLRIALYERTACQILNQGLRYVYRCNKIECHCMLHERTAAKWSASYIHNHVVDPRCRSGRRQRSLSNIDSFQRLHGRVQLWMSASLFLFPFVCPQTHSKLHVQDCTTELPVTPYSELHFCPLTHPHLCLVCK